MTRRIAMHPDVVPYARHLSLSDSEISAIEKHLQECGECRDLVIFVRKTSVTLQYEGIVHRIADVLGISAKALEEEVGRGTPIGALIANRLNRRLPHPTETPRHSSAVASFERIPSSHQLSGTVADFVDYEEEVLSCVLKGLSPQQTAKSMGMTEEAVLNYFKSAVAKMTQPESSAARWPTLVVKAKRPSHRIRRQFRE